MNNEFNIKYRQEPTDLQCGQAVIAMLLDIDVKAVCDYLGNDRETTLQEMKKILGEYGFTLANRQEAKCKADLPEIALLSLETPRCWHWSLYFDGVFYDPEHGVLNDFPECKRKYYFEVTKNP